MRLYGTDFGYPGFQTTALFVEPEVWIDGEECKPVMYGEDAVSIFQVSLRAWSQPV